jgi:hypothetical protein
MKIENLSEQEIVNLMKAVFPGIEREKELGILVDIPASSSIDNEDWRVRRAIAEEWFTTLDKNKTELNLQKINLIAYSAVGANNADLPAEGYLIKNTLPSTSTLLPESGRKISFEDIFQMNQIFLAPTENSATAPLKNASKKFGFRAATMPGFNPAMIPALRIDYKEVSRRCKILKTKLDPAITARVLFKHGNAQYEINFDLRYRTAHLSSARFPDKGTAGNLPSGETYIVPYEGEKGTESLTNGTLPVQINQEILLFRIVQNKAISVSGYGKEFEREEAFLKEEPAYGNMAELGFGVLSDFGLNPINEILLDEKLGFHVAFGRSDHFGGAVAPSDFSTPENVIHLDRIYIPATQPDIKVKSIVLKYEDGKEEEIINNGKYLIF